MCVTNIKLKFRLSNTILLKMVKNIQHSIVGQRLLDDKIKLLYVLLDEYVRY